MPQLSSAAPILLALALTVLPSFAEDYSNVHDRPLIAVMAEREADWRNGAIVYQVLVDRFAPSARLDSKAQLYAPPRRLRGWHEVPRRGDYLPEVEVWSHEIDFWGGDLDSLRAQLEYIDELGVDVLYLNPIHYGFTNHKYDALDYRRISPEFGSREDLRELIDAVHARGMRIVLDGVFNHMGRNAPVFRDALENPHSPYRDWFYFDERFPAGYRAWAGALNLPEINLENPAVRDYVFGAEDSPVRSYLADGVDGWRLDVAYDIGFAYLAELTRAAHRQRPGSLVIGEIWSYPKQWMPALDGVMNFTAREIILAMLRGEIPADQASRMFDRMVADTGIEPLLKSWLLLDNHDVQRLHTEVPDRDLRRIAQVLQFTLPGSPNLYYGTELGMTGGRDPEMRAPMRWDLVDDDNPELRWTRQLLAMRAAQRALRIGEYRPVLSDRLLAFERHTDRVAETVLVVANPGAEPVQEWLSLANSKLMNHGSMRDQLGAGVEARVAAGLLRVNLPARSVVVLQPDVAPQGGWTPYKRVR